MGYASSLTDKEWAIIEPLLPQKNKTRPPLWTKREILDAVFYSKMAVIGVIYPKIFPLIRLYSGTTSNGEPKESLPK